MSLNIDIKIDAKVELHLREDKDISKEDLKVLDSLLKESSSLVKKLERVDKLTPAVPKERKEVR